MKFRKKPVVIEAAQWNPRASCEDLPEWFWDYFSLHPEINAQDESITIHTLEGAMKCSPGDWIIKGIKGEIYPCKPDIFEATYETV